MAICDVDINHHRTIHHIAYTSPSSKYMFSKALGCICMSSLMDIENKSNQLYPKREMYKRHEQFTS